jgi:hypothetical protein
LLSTLFLFHVFSHFSYKSYVPVSS